MTVVRELKLRFLQHLGIAVLFNGLLVLGGWLLPSYVGWILWLYAAVNFPAYIIPQYLRLRKLWNSPFIYLAEIERLTEKVK